MRSRYQSYLAYMVQMCETVNGMSSLVSSPTCVRIMSVVLASSDAALAQLLSSSTAITRTWPQAGEDVRLLVHLLKISQPSLAQALRTGLVVLASWSHREAGLTLVSGAAVLHGVAQDNTGSPIPDPHGRAHEVRQLLVLDVVAEGRSAMKVA
jgi:hypothetical protein